MSKPENPALPPRYNEEEVALILKKAAELQQFGGHAGDSRSLSLAEIEKVGEEAGISAALVRRAAREVAVPTRAAHKVNHFLGGPRQITIEAVVQGEYPTEHFDLLVEAIRHQSDQIGQVSEVGRTMTWTGDPAQNVGAAISISVSVRDGHTRIRLNRRLDQMAGGIFGGLLGGVGGGFSPLVGIGLASVAGPFGAVAGVLGTLGLVYGGCRKIFAYNAAKYEREGQAIVQELVRVCKGQLDVTDTQ